MFEEEGVKPSMLLKEWKERELSKGKQRKMRRAHQPAVPRSQSKSASKQDSLEVEEGKKDRRMG